MIAASIRCTMSSSPRWGRSRPRFSRSPAKRGRTWSSRSTATNRNPPSCARRTSRPRFSKISESLAQECYALLGERQLPFGGLPEVRPEGGKNPESFNLTSALYHVSGASSFTFECSHGIRGNCEVTLDQILNIELSLYEAMLQHEISKPAKAWVDNCARTIAKAEPTAGR